MSTTKENLQKLTESWKKHIAKIRATGQTTKKWCENHNIKTTKLYYWLINF